MTTKGFLKKKWMWLIYIVMFGVLIFERLFAFISPTEHAYLYYKILTIMSINSGHVPLSFIFTIASLILNTAALVFLWLYILDKKCFSLSFLLVFTAGRITSDLLGHSYEWNTIKSLYYQSEWAAWTAGLNLFFLMLPSYLAMGDYVVQKIKKHQISNLK